MGGQSLTRTPAFHSLSSPPFPSVCVVARNVSLIEVAKAASPSAESKGGGHVDPLAKILSDALDALL